MASTTLTVNGVDNASSALKSVSDSVGALTNALGTAGLMMAFKNMGEEASNDERNLLSLQNNLNNLGKVTGVTSDVITTVNNKFKELGLFSADAVTEAENVLTHFTEIGQNVFPQVIDTAGQLALALGETLSQASQTLGMALQNPEKGYKALAVCWNCLNRTAKGRNKDGCCFGRYTKGSSNHLEDGYRCYTGHD